MIKVLVVSDNQIFRELLYEYLSSLEEISVIGKISLDEIEHHSYLLSSDIVLFLEKCDSMTIKRDILALKKNFPKAKIIFLSLRDIRGDMELNVIKMGAKGFLCAKDSLKTLIQAIKSCYNGEIWATRRSTNIIIDNLQGKIITRKKDEVDILTPQEKKVLILLASGFKNAEIAQKLFISEKTVKTHINKIFKKIKVTNRLQAALWASKNLSRT
ncbi:LuxR family transcriptional regulator [Candidatus Desulfofervidus auxilii]|uniref:LuxR family transcriptional regulator n=2 Tax=Desulfofervidus auxilii TaxID=1621989 RepID=A0A7U4QLS2_DESA2|nr:response regulator transcription factor [Candidatus Desulfofervidus auxilii]AMM41685.1 LuxR family transcriptional regulator [Candidatus Desulfofervidus auxilii]CAD7779266.1 Transcriptional regulatory protein DegU [Candidatus Methanoperedenaceae archaeon GB50]